MTCEEAVVDAAWSEAGEKKVLFKKFHTIKQTTSWPECIGPYQRLLIIDIVITGILVPKSGI